MSLDLAGYLPRGPGFGFFQFVLGSVKDLLDPPAQQVQPSDHAGAQFHIRGQELITDAGFRISILDQAHLLTSGKSDQTVGINPEIDRIVAIKGPLFKVLGGDVILSPRDHERTALTQLRLLLPELVIDKGRIQDAQRCSLAFALGELLAQELRQGIAKHRHLMPITTISLDGRQIEQQAAMQTEQVKGVGSDLPTFAIAQGMTGVLDFVAVDCPDTAPLQFWKELQKVGGLALTSPGVEFPRSFVEELESALGVQAIEERTA